MTHLTPEQLKALKETYPVSDDLLAANPCSMQDYLVCPLKGRDDLDIRTGKRQ